MVTATGVASARVASPRQRRFGYVALAALSYLPVLWTAPGEVAADTKQYLYLDPDRLLGRAASMWDPNIGLGTVTHQNIGYLFPMGPYYWVCEHLGIPDWVAQRLWLGSIVFLAGLGVLYLLRTLDLRGPGVPVGALAYMLSPYLLNYSARISVILLPFAGLPWMLAFAIRALRRGGWRYPALFAVTVQLVGGVNATALAFALVAPGLWIPYAVFVRREVTLRRALATSTRLALLVVATSLWWVAGLSLQAGYGLDILRYTETVRTVAKASVAPEVFRGLGYWFFYGRDKLGPWIESSVSYTQWLWLILVSYAIPTFALVSAALVRWRHRVFFALLAFVGLAISVGAHPYEDPSWFGATMKAFAERSSAGLALRSTGRAVPLVALSLAVFLALGVNALTPALRARLAARSATLSRYGIALPALVAVVVVANFPALVDGTYYGENLRRPEDIPGYWEEAAAALDRSGDGTRVLELPGADFASYRWGNTVDPITPGIMDRPYVARELIPWGSPASADLLNALDRRLQEGTLDPASIAPVARLLAVGDVVARYDLQVDRYNLIRPVPMKLLLTPPPHGLDEPESYGDDLGPPLHFPLLDETALALPAEVPDPPPVVIYPVQDAVPIVRARGTAPSLVLAGDGEGLVGAAAVGLVTADGIVVYSASRTPGELAAALADDTTLVVTDSNRRRARRWSTVRDNLGYTERPDEVPLVHDPSDARLDVFPDADVAASTVTEQHGATVTATAYGNPVSYTPEDRAARALDGDLETAWKVGAFAPVVGERIRVDLDRPVTTDRLELVQPLIGDRDRYITRATLTFHDGSHVTEERIDLDEGSRTPQGQVVTFAERRFDRIEIVVDADNVGARADYVGVSAVGFAEITIRDRGAGEPVRVLEVVRMPTDLTDGVGEASHEHRLVFLMERLRIHPVPPRYDEELHLSRAFTVPTERELTIGGEARLSSAAPDTVLDRALGYPGPAEGGIAVTPSARLPGAITARASQAVDGDPSTAWTTTFRDPTGHHVEIETPEPVTFDRLALQVVADGRHSVPTRLRVEAGGETRLVELPPVEDGSDPDRAVAVPTAPFAPLTGDRIRVTIEAVREVRTIDYFSASPITLPVAVAELGIPGVERPEPAGPPFPTCLDDLVFLDGAPVPVRLTGDRDAAERRAALSLEPCDAGDPIRLAPGRHVLSTAIGRDGGIDVDRLTLASDAGGGALPLDPHGVVPEPPPRPAPPELQVRDSRTSLSVDVSGAAGPFTLVLGQSFNAGWHATIGGDDLGPPTLVDGYANGWIVDPGEAESFTIELEWMPQRRVWWALGVSAAALLACLVLVIVTWGRRRIAPAAVPVHDPPAELLGIAAEGRTPGTAATVVAGMVVAAGVAFFVHPAVGLLLGVLAAAAVRSTRIRWVLRIGSPAALGACAVYIAVQQWRYSYPPVFEWPTFFDRAHVLGWLAGALLAADAVVEIARTWTGPGSAGAGTPAEPPADVPARQWAVEDSNL